MIDSTNNKTPTFKYWCYKVLPLVYDDSLSYYEVLCKLYDYINSMVDDDKQVVEEIEKLKAELEVVKHWIDTFDTTFIKDIVDDYIATMIFVEITKSGYFIYYVPEEWSDITFNTTGLDIDIVDEATHQEIEYGKLVLSY